MVPKIREAIENLINIKLMGESESKPNFRTGPVVPARIAATSTIIFPILPIIHNDVCYNHSNQPRRDTVKGAALTHRRKFTQLRQLRETVQLVRWKLKSRNLRIQKPPYTRRRKNGRRAYK